MVINTSLEELKQKARDLARYYHKGFGSTINMIIDDAIAYYSHPRIEYADRVQKYLPKIEELYSRIPLLSLKAGKNFCLCLKLEICFLIFGRL